MITPLLAVGTNSTPHVSVKWYIPVPYPPRNALIAPLLHYWHKLSPQEVLKCPLLTHKGQNVPASLTLQPPHHRTVGPDNGLVIQAQAVFTTTCVGLILVSAERGQR
ncbi:hypothetical protein Bbelb_165060 [Branchiostoma belcheri]|nr:hypothetical protein Bbelb_165060 [Branchiostoma belcheri]